MHSDARSSGTRTCPSWWRGDVTTLQKQRHLIILVPITVLIISHHNTLAIQLSCPSLACRLPIENCPYPDVNQNIEFFMKDCFFHAPPPQPAWSYIANTEFESRRRWSLLARNLLYICPTTMLLSILSCLDYKFLPPNKIQIKITSNFSELHQSLNWENKMLKKLYDRQLI